jgi:hypothetical protein
MADEVTDPVETTPTATAATTTDSGQLSAAEQNRIFAEEFERITAPAEEQISPPEEKPSMEERPRRPDGKFLPKEGETADNPSVKPTDEKPADAAATPATTTQKPQPSALPSATGPLFDVDAMIASVQAEVDVMQIDDVDGTKTTGEKALKEYGQIADPIMARQDKMIRAVVEKMTEMIRPALEVAHARQAETAQSAVQTTIDALVADGVSDAAQLIDDPRMADFASKNPHYAALLVADPSRIEDIKFVMSKFRTANGIAAPSGAKRGAAAPIQRQRPSNALQAAVSSARGSGNARDEGGIITGSPEDIMRAEFNRLEQLEQRAGRAGRI